MAITWAETALPNTAGHAQLSDVAWSPALGIFVMVGNEIAPNPAKGIAYTSPDGVTWTPRTTAEANNYRGVAWSPSLNRFCAVANNGTNRVMTSPDGVTWTARAASAVAGWRAITWCDTLGLFVAVGATSVAMWSPDGITWTNGTGVPASKAYAGVVWASAIGKLVAVANTAGTTSIMTSTDGKAWTAQTHPTVVFLCPGGATLGGASNAAWSPTAGQFCVPAKITSSPNLYAPLTSPDGVTWTQRTLPVAADIAPDFLGICWDPVAHQFLAVGSQTVSNGKCIWTSSDGVTWTATFPGITLTFPNLMNVFTNPAATFLAYQGSAQDLLVRGVSGPAGGLSPSSGVGGGGTLITITHQP